MMAETGLPEPAVGTVLPDAPDPSKCNRCTKRPSLYQPCRDCEWAAHIAQHLPDTDSLRGDH